MKLNKKYVIFWLILLAAFLFGEFSAILDPATGDTLSEMVWAILDIHRVIWYTFAGFMAWLVIHFLGKGKFG